MSVTFAPTEPPAQPLSRPLGSRPPKPPRPPLWPRLFGFLSGFGLATTLLVILGLLTWFATLEQIDSGLHATLRKYFDWRALVVIPKVGIETVPLPLPGGYWVCALLFVNLLLGSLLRVRRTLSSIGIFTAHAGILLLLVAGAVAHHSSERGHMMIPEGAASNVAEDYFEHTVEIVEIKDGKPAAIQVVRGRYLQDLDDFRIRSVALPGLPFDMEFARYHPNAEVKSAALEPPPPDTQALKGYYLAAKPPDPEAERNTPACIARIVRRNGEKESPFLLSAAAYHPFTVHEDGRTFTISLRKRQWVMPFSLRLDKVIAEYYPGTMKPAKYISEVTRLEGSSTAAAVIRMNEPMRYAGLTFYQSGYQRLGPQADAPQATVLEVVKNPADQWPLYCLCVVTVGLLIHFVSRLVVTIQSLTRSRSDAPA